MSGRCGCLILVLPNEVSEANAHNYFVGSDGVLGHNAPPGHKL